MPLANVDRPRWNENILRKVGFNAVDSKEITNPNIWDKRYQIAYRSIPTFVIKAIKGGENNE